MASIKKQSSMTFHNSLHLCQSLVNNFLVDHTHKKIVNNNKALRKKVVDACESVYRGSLQNNINPDTRPNISLKEQHQPSQPGHNELLQRKKIGKIRGKRTTNRCFQGNSQIDMLIEQETTLYKPSSKTIQQQITKQKLIPLKDKKQRFGLINKQNNEIEQKLREQKIKKQELLNQKMTKKFDYSSFQKLVSAPIKKNEKKTVVTYDYDATFLSVKANQCYQYAPHYQNVDFSIRNGHSVDKQKRNVLLNCKNFKKYIEKLKTNEQTNHTKNYTTIQTEWNQHPNDYSFLQSIQSNLQPVKGVKIAAHSSEKKNIFRKIQNFSKKYHNYSKNISKTEVQNCKNINSQLKTMNFYEFIQYKKSSMRINTQQQQFQQKDDISDIPILGRKSKLGFTLEYQNKTFLKENKKILVNNSSLYLNLLQDTQTQNHQNRQMEQSKQNQFKSTTNLSSELSKKNYY